MLEGVCLAAVIQTRTGSWDAGAPGYYIFPWSRHLENPCEEKNDTRISLDVSQRGKYAVSKEPLRLGDMEVHLQVPESNKGLNNYASLMLVTGVHKRIHATDPDTTRKYLDKLKAVKTE